MSDEDEFTTSPYTLDEWIVLKQEIERQGGALLPDRCEGKLLTYKEPQGAEFKTRTCTCGNESMFVTTYEVAGKKKQVERMKESGAGFARVCGVCDALGEWPRYRHVLSEDEE